MRIKEVSKEIHSLAKHKGFWDKPDRNVGELLMLVTSELGEALEADRQGRHADKQAISKVDWRSRHDDVEEFVHNFREHIKDTFEDEIADAVIRLFDLAEAMGIDLETHIRLKTDYNKTRGRLHGKKY